LASMMSVVRLSVGVLRQVGYLDVVGVLNCNETDGWPKLFLPVTDASGNLPTNHTNKKYQDAPKKARQRLIIKKFHTALKIHHCHRFKRSVVGLTPTPTLIGTTAP
jgi:hypothetical protein